MVDPESGETQMALATESPSTPRLYIGRTRELWAAPLFALPSLAITVQAETARQTVSQQTCS